MSHLLGPAEIRQLAAGLGVHPTKKLGQNFVHDPNTVRRIVTAAGLDARRRGVEVGPGLGSLTLALLPAAAHVHAVEIDPVLAGALPITVADGRRPSWPPGSPCTPRRAAVDAAELPTRRRPRWSPTCPTTWPYRSSCTCSPSCRHCGTGW